MRGRQAVVIGGGRVAERKVAALLEAGAHVRVVAPAFTPELDALCSGGRIVCACKTFDDADLDGAALAFAATDDDAVNASVVTAAQARGILVNDAGKGERGDFSTPAVHRKDSVTIAVDTGGTAPAVAKLLREQIGALADRVLSGALVCASRSSRLAMLQTRIVMAKLARSGVASTVVTISTKGDEIQDRSIASIGESIFVKELELALRERRADYAVHSCKDLPSALPDDMELVAIVERADPRDVYCSERYPQFADLPKNARVGTSSPRREAQLHSLRDDLEYLPIRGNVDTRLRKLASGDFDAIVLAAAGLDRLDARAKYSVPFAVETIVPAVGQGALAVEMRRGDELAALLRSALNDGDSELEVLAERAFLRAMRGGCQAPIGGHARLDRASRTLTFVAAAGSPERGIVRTQHAAAVRTAAEAEAIGGAAAAELGRSLLERTP